MTTRDAEDAFLASAREALRRDPGIGAFDALGVWDLLADFDDPESRAAIFAVFRAHGRELGRSAALGCLMAHPYLDGGGAPAGSVALALPRRSARRGDVLLLLGEPAKHVLVDRPGLGVGVVPLDRVELRPVTVPGRMILHELSFDPNDLTLVAPEARAEAARERSRFLGRVAAAFEILGAAEGALDLALAHARTREQFGGPIGRFQAVRHLLAWARTDCAAVAELARHAAALGHAAPAKLDELVKALAGRNGRRVCERTLQVMGGIGFTAEQDHHHFYSRVLALDAVLGTSAELTRGLGAWLRESRAEPELPRALLHRGRG